MKKNKLTIYFCAFVLLYFCLPGSLETGISVLPVHAGIIDEIRTQLGLFNNNQGQGAQLATAQGDITPIIINIINIILGFLGIVFLVLILYGGFTYMTAGGDPNKAKKATGIIHDSIIGVIIILFSWAFVNFVLVQIIEAFNSPPPTP